MPRQNSVISMETDGAFRLYCITYFRGISLKYFGSIAGFCTHVGAHTFTVYGRRVCNFLGPRRLIKCSQLLKESYWKQSFALNNNMERSEKGSASTLRITKTHKKLSERLTRFNSIMILRCFCAPRYLCLSQYWKTVVRRKNHRYMISTIESIIQHAILSKCNIFSLFSHGGFNIIMKRTYWLLYFFGRMIWYVVYGLCLICSKSNNR